MLTPHCSAASGMVAPPSIVSTIRLRRSSEYGFAIHAGLLPVASLNQIRARMGIRFSLFGKCSNLRRSMITEEVVSLGGVGAGKPVPVDNHVECGLIQCEMRISVESRTF